MYEIRAGIPVWGRPDAGALKQMATCARQAHRTALMADHHLGYAVPIGGVVAYLDQVSPSGVGYDIACGNKAVQLDIKVEAVRPQLAEIMDEIYTSLSFGVGRVNDEEVAHPLFEDDPAWDLEVAAELKDLARRQLGTIGSGNHYVDLLSDGDGLLWCGVHFGSRGLGHKLASHFIKAGGGKDGMQVEPVVLQADSFLGREYIACMKLAGRYAYAGRNWVCDKVAALLGGRIVQSVHNHHNFAWQEVHGGQSMWVVRKGATPCWPGQRSFIGGSMGDISVIIEGKSSAEAPLALHSTVHGAGRVMSRTRARGKHKWKRGRQGKKQLIKVSEGEISEEMMRQWIRDFNNVELRGGGTDESPQVYKRLSEVLEYHQDSFAIKHVLHPIGVAMAGGDIFDPFRD